MFWKESGEQRRILLRWKVRGKYINSWANGVWKNNFCTGTKKMECLAIFKEIYWVSKIPLSLEREKNISDCFKKPVDLRYPNSLEDFNVCLDLFQRKRE